MAQKKDDKPRGGLTRRDFLTSTAATASLGALGLASSAHGNQTHSAGPARHMRRGGSSGRRPNFLVMMVDEMRFPPPYESAQTQAFRDTYLKTQNALRNQGLEFQRHYAASVACSPSRASIYTGQYPSLHGVTQTTGAAKASFDPDVFELDPNSVPTIGDYFRAAGYQTYWKGKWHASDADMLIPGTHDQLVSYDTDGAPNQAVESLYLDADRLDDYGFSGWIGPEPHGASPLNSGSSAQDALGRDEGFANQAQQLIAQLDQSDDDTPWLVVSSFVNPHDITLYGFVTETLPLGFEFDIEEIVPKRLFKPGMFGRTHREKLRLNNKPRCQASYRDAYHSVFQPIIFDERYYRLYYQLHKNVDEQLMKVYQALLDSRFRNNTIVIFTSDHGDLLGAHGDMHQKWYQAYEEALHVPLIISNPRLFPQAQSTDALTSHVDLLPTMLGLAGLDADDVEELRGQLAQNHSDAQPLVGRDLSPLVLGQTDPDGVNDPIFFMTDDDPSRGLNQNNWVGIPYASVIQPNHIETVIARLDDGKVWKYSRYFDNEQFWSNPCSPDAATPCVPQDVVVRPPEDEPQPNLPVQEVTYTVTVKRRPRSEEFEMYNVTDDPTELSNLYGRRRFASQQATMEALLQEQCSLKRLTPWSGSVPGQPTSCDV